MALVAPDLDRKVVACLEAKCGTLADAVLIVHAADGGALDALGVRDLSSFGGPDVYIPESRARVVWERVVAFHDCGVFRATGTSRSNRGRRNKAVSEAEANKAAEIYMHDPDGYAAHEDDGAYAVHELYTRNRERDKAMLSRPMVGHLILALRNGWLGWDADDDEGDRLRISDEFRTSEGLFVIPREPVS